MKSLSQKFVLTLAVLALLFAPMASQANTMYATPSTVSLTMNVSETLSVSCTPASVSFTYNPSGAGSATASGPISCVTTWSIGPSRAAITSDSWVGSASAALTNGVTNIPASQVFASLNGASAVPCTGNDGAMTGETPNGQCSNWFETSSTTPALTLTGNRTDTVLLSLNNLGSTLQPGSYSGVFSYSAYVQ
jgi:hypothetical protein